MARSANMLCRDDPEGPIERDFAIRLRVHSALGPSQLEHVYEVILAHELKNQHRRIANNL